MSKYNYFFIGIYVGMFLTLGVLGITISDSFVAKGLLKQPKFYMDGKFYKLEEVK